MSYTYRAVPGPIPATRVAEVSCDHGRTRTQLRPGQPASVGVLVALVTRHAADHHCGCCVDPRPARIGARP